MSSKPHRAATLSLLGYALLSVCGCQTAPAPSRAAPAVIASPVEVARSLNELHRNRDYERLAGLIIPEARDSTVALLKAVNDVVSASRFMQRLAQQKYNGPVAEALSLAAMENNLGIFSKDVTFYSQTFKGERAFVTLQEGEHVPLVHAEFEFRDNRWLFVPEKAPRALSREIQTLASLLWDICDQVRKGIPVTSFLDAFALKVAPQVRKAMTVRDMDVLAGGNGDNAGP